MRILLLGATGLIGGAALARLVDAGHDVVAVARRAGGPMRHVTWLALDIGRLTTADGWLAHLRGVDAVVNCAGAMQRGLGTDLGGVHVEGIAALFDACEAAGVKRVVHVSAINAEREPLTPFSATKQAGEQALQRRDLDWVILRPSVVLGRAAYGGSALMRGLAALPIVPEMQDAGPLQVVQLDEVVETIVFFCAPEAPSRLALDVAGPDRLALADVVLEYKRWLDQGGVHRVRIPRAAAAVAHKLGDLAHLLGWHAPLGSTARAELARGASGDPQPWTAVTGISPQPLARGLAREPVSVQERWFARLYLLKPVVLVILVAFWLLTGVVSLGPGWEIGLAYLAEGGVTGWPARFGVVAGAAADIAIGLGIAVRRTCRMALYAAFGISVFYMVTGSFVLPVLWADPVGPMLKIWPIMALNLVALAILPDR